jgi:hypothetical protein
METDRSMSTTQRVAFTFGCLALVALVAYLDWLSTSYIAFSVFYVVPIAVAAWYGDRTLALVVAVACGLGGLIADLSAPDAHLGFALVNLCCRLVLFSLVATLISRARSTRDREQRLSELEREATQRLQELNDMKDELMRSVIVGAREPLGDIYARIVTLGFDLPTLSVTETRAVLAEIADASRRLSALVNHLVPDATVFPPANGSTADAPASSA